jgi:3-dehydroquinate dehydratase II
MSKLWIIFLLLAPLYAQPVAAPSAPGTKLRILVVHGPNMNMLGRREPAIYGSMTMAEVNDRIKKVADEMNVEPVFFQSNHIGEIVDFFQKHIDDADGAILNAAGYSQGGVAIHDVMKTVPWPTIEVHMTQLATRDEIHQGSVISAAARGSVMGLGWRSYTMALRAVSEIVREEKKAQSPKSASK